MRHLVTLLVLLLWGIGGAAQAAEARKIWLIAAGDVSPSAHWGQYAQNVRMDLLNMMIVFSSSIPESQLEFRQLQIDEDEFSDPQWILDGLRDVAPAPADTLVFYYTGHGAADDRGHYLAMAKGKLYRDTLLDTLTSKGTRLTVLLTDCCNVRGDGMIFAAPNVQILPPEKITPLFQALFLDPIGVVNINSSAPGESAFFKPDDPHSSGSAGSIFTSELVTWLDGHQNERRSWDELVHSVSLQVHTSFHACYPKGAQTAKGQPVQQQQNVYPISYPGMSERQGPRTGLVLRDVPGGGALIVKVTENSPAAKVFDLSGKGFTALTPQTLVLSVNGQPVTGANSMAQLIRQAPQIVRMRVREPSGRQYEVLMRMKY